LWPGSDPAPQQARASVFNSSRRRPPILRAVHPSVHRR
jgi:hypothetical protein